MGVNMISPEDKNILDKFFLRAITLSKELQKENFESTDLFKEEQEFFKWWSDYNMCSIELLKKFQGEAVGSNINIFVGIQIGISLFYLHKHGKLL